MYNEKKEIFGYPKDEGLTELIWDTAEINICPHCIMKYQLFKETKTTPKELEPILNLEEVSYLEDLACGVEGCFNRSTISGELPIQKCSINGISLKETEDELTKNPCTSYR